MAPPKQQGRKRSSSFQQQQKRLDSLFHSKGENVSNSSDRKKRSKSVTKPKSKKNRQQTANDRKKNPRRGNGDSKKRNAPSHSHLSGKKRSRNKQTQQHSSKRQRCSFSFPRSIPSTIHWKKGKNTTSNQYSLDQELSDFSDYVKLGPKERAVRDNWASKLHNISPIAVFGSHSVPEVCAYCSDLDIILLQQHDGDEGESLKKSSPPPPVPVTPPVEDAPGVSKASLDQKKKRWLEALAEADSANDASNGSGEEDAAEEKCGEQDAESKRAEEDVAESRRQKQDDDWFAIDRTGERPTPPPAQSNVIKLEEESNEESTDAFVPESEREEDSDEDSADPLVRDSKKRKSSIVSVEACNMSASARSEDQPIVSFAVTRNAIKPPYMNKADVVRVLQVFRNKIHKRYRTLVLRSQVIRARVPIIKLSTVTGCETDIACGGNMGNDTSLYAAAKVKESPCFGPVVLFLKILLNQQDLDVPFTGGLGSYKLYVMVSDQCRRCEGGSLGLVLITFLNRFADPELSDIDGLGTDKPRFIGSDGASADLSNVYRWDDCCALFGAVLLHLQRNDCRLAAVIHADQLHSDRQQHQSRFC